MRWSRAQQVGAAVGAAALLSAAVLGGVALTAGPDTAPPRAAPAPEQSPSATPSPTPSPSPSPTRPPASLPERYAAALDDELVVDAVARSAPRTLARFDAQPEGPEGEPGQYLVGVDIAVDGTVVYADVCCEPASGLVRGYPVDGSPAAERPVMFAGWPAVSPDGRTLAGFALEMLGLTVLADGDPRITILLDAPADGRTSRSAVAWAPDESLVFLEAEVVEPPTPEGPSQVVLLGPRQSPRSFAPPEGMTYAAPVVRADGMLVVARQPVDPDATSAATGVVLDPADGAVVAEFALDGRVVDQDYDRTGTFLLTTYESGRLAWQGAGRSGVLRETGVAAAAW